MSADVLAARAAMPPLCDPRAAAELREWLDEGRRPGPFILACLRGDFQLAADMPGLGRVSDAAALAAWLIRDVPHRLWGNDARVSDWITRCGLRGRVAASRPRLVLHEGGRA